MHDGHDGAADARIAPQIKLVAEFDQAGRYGEGRAVRELLALMTELRDQVRACDKQDFSASLPRSTIEALTAFFEVAYLGRPAEDDVGSDGTKSMWLLRTPDSLVARREDTTGLAPNQTIEAMRG